MGNERREKMRQWRAYGAGRRAARRERSVTAKTARRLSTNPDFWAGWHDARSVVARHEGAPVEDPTRPGGWCVPTS